MPIIEADRRETGDIGGRKYPLVKGLVLEHCMPKSKFCGFVIHIKNLQIKALKNTLCLLHSHT